MRKLFIILLLSIFSILNASITHFWPDAAVNDTSLSVHIFGNNFLAGINEIKLIKSGSPDIIATNIIIEKDNFLKCDFDFNNMDIGSYSLVVNLTSYQDTVDLGFLIYERIIDLIGLGWDTTIVGAGNYYMRQVCIGDGDNDGEFEIYATSEDNSLYQFKWNGSDWIKTTLGSGNNNMDGVVVGDGDNDGVNEVYSGNWDGNVYLFKWNGSTWNKTIIGSGGNRMYGVVIGDGNNDGLCEVFSLGYDHNLYQFSWNGSIWIKEIIGNGFAQMIGIDIGDGNNDGELEIYTACADGHLYQFKLYGTTWGKTILGFSWNWMFRIDVNDGDNDGLLEVYAANWDGHIYQYKWIGNRNFWEQTDIGFGSGGYYDGMMDLCVYDADNDGYNEVYGASNNNPIYLFKYNDGNWTKENLFDFSSPVYGLTAGNGDNTDKIKIFAACCDNNIYMFSKIQMYDIAIYLTEDMHNFGNISLNDSSTWSFYIKSVGDSNLQIDSIKNNLDEYNFYNINLPLIILSSDSHIVEVMYKPESIGIFIDTLKIYSNAENDPISYVNLRGMCDTVFIGNITYIWPLSGVNDTTIELNVFGNGFSQNVNSLKLIKPGYPDIVTESINIISNNYLKCEFNLNNVSTGLYKLSLNRDSAEDTFNLFFSVCERINDSTDWVKKNVGSGNNIMRQVCIGDGNNDGELEIYTSCESGNVYQIKWNGNNMIQSTIGAGTHIVDGVVVGDGDNDGELEVYTGCWDGNVYVFKWINNSWYQAVIGSGNNRMYGVVVGDGDCDGKYEVYSIGYDCLLYKFSWDGSNWIKEIIGNTPNVMIGIAIGDGNNDGELEIYTTCADGNLYQFKYNYSGGWDKTSIGSSYDWMFKVVVGDGDNDGEFEVYVANWDNYIYQFRFTGSSWNKEYVGYGGDDMLDVCVGDGDNDGYYEVFSACCDGKTSMYKWNGSTWFKTNIGTEGFNNYIFGLAVGDADEDGKLEVYSVNRYGEVNQHIVQLINNIEENITSDQSFQFSYISPSKNRTEFRLHIPQRSIINLSIYDISGREIVNLMSGECQKGEYIIPFIPEAKGLYFYRLESELLNRSGKVMILE